MSNRILSRVRARELSQDELEKILGTGKCCTRATLFSTGTPANPDENFDQ